jgi:hypothetical protein
MQMATIERLLPPKMSDAVSTEVEKRERPDQ